ncbi:squalene/phytoene synthase family protein [Sorangium sp. So ce1036]|uniref:squalene/phytoene synthase family protein n=1 Tax=Sorangium sp. So ce1036 TaxID=3133328 RepID=UPI003F051F2F
MKPIQPTSSRLPRPSAPAPLSERTAYQPISTVIGSSHYRALADDALKDEDNAAWVLTLAPDVRQAWLDRIRWIRIVDRLAENERIEPHERRFSRFMEDWRRLLSRGIVDPSCPFASELLAIRALWLRDASGPGSDLAEGRRGGDDMAARSLAAWDAYLLALADYHAPGLLIRTMKEHDTMLLRLSGHIFQLVPFLTKAHWDAAAEFGRLDQFFNNLRDMQEDADRGLCYLPEEELARHGLTRAQVLSGRCIDTPGYRSLMQFWLDEIMPSLYARAAPFIDAHDLHPSLQMMKEWSLRRYARITRVFRATGFDPRRFPARYWAEVRRDLAERRQLCRAQPA